MNIALLNMRVTFQKTEVIVDEIGNHTNGWVDYFSCHATVSGEGGENTEAGLTTDTAKLSFTVRYCRKLSELSETEYRVVFQGEPYNITAVDHMNYKRKCLKVKCEKVRT